ncbi:MAG: hypothetical protein WBY94_18045 [Polyangiaceae bacterium]
MSPRDLARILLALHERTLGVNGKNDHPFTHLRRRVAIRRRSSPGCDARSLLMRLRDAFKDVA